MTWGLKEFLIKLDDNISCFNYCHIIRRYHSVLFIVVANDNLASELGKLIIAGPVRTEIDKTFISLKHSHEFADYIKKFDGFIAFHLIRHELNVYEEIYLQT